MSSRIALFFTLPLFFFSAHAFNITNLLNQYSDFSKFNHYLTQTGLADQINSRQTITILAVDNSAISPLSGKPDNVLKNIMSVHVVLDYYDVKKLQNLPNKTDILTTLFQSSGIANNQQGFLNVTDLSTGTVAIGSAVQGATSGANVVKSVASQPYNISVLQISRPIIPSGIDNAKSNTSTSPSSSPPAPAPKKPSSPKKSPSPAPGPAVATPSDASTGDAPGPAAADADAKKSNEATALGLTFGVGIMIVAWTFFLT